MGDGGGSRSSYGVTISFLFFLEVCEGIVGGLVGYLLIGIF